MKYSAPRKYELDRLTAKGWRVITFKAAPVVVAFEKTESGKVFAKGWKGKADKPAFYYSFKSEAQAREYVERFVSSVASADARKQERRESRKAVSASDFYMVGDVVYNSWGYDQTNVDFYQVVEVKAKSIVLREVKQNSSDRGAAMAGMTQPVRGEFCGEPFTKIVGQSGYIAFDHGCGSKWDGRAKYTSSYA